MPSNTNKEQYAKAICLFLAEQLRTRHIDLVRASEVAQKVVENLNLIDTEEQFLKFVRTLTADFEELTLLAQKIGYELKTNHRIELEEQIKAFVIEKMATDMNLVSALLAEATNPNCDLNQLKLKYHI